MAYIAAQEKLGIAVSPNDYAALTAAEERGGMVKALAERSLERADYERLTRVYSARATADSAFAMELSKAVMAAKK